jgi:uncharacterized membrane protein YjfL (UPF0719 family)
MDYFVELTAGLLYGAVGIALMVAGYYLLDLLTPGHLGRVICERRSPNAAIMASTTLLGIGAIITVAIATSGDDLGGGLADSAGYGALGIALQGVGFKVIDVVTPGDLGEILMRDRLEPLALVAGSFNLALGAILAAAIS